MTNEFNKDRTRMLTNFGECTVQMVNVKKSRKSRRRETDKKLVKSRSAKCLAAIIALQLSHASSVYAAESRLALSTDNLRRMIARIMSPEIHD